MDAPITHVDGLGAVADGVTAPVNTGAPAPQARQRAVIPQRPGTGLEWIPKMLPVAGLGDDSTTLLAAATRMVLNGAAGTVVGLALAPGHDKRTKYAVIGGLLGFFLGPLGIGGQAVYVLAKE